LFDTATESAWPSGEFIAIEQTAIGEVLIALIIPAGFVHRVVERISPSSKVDQARRAFHEWPLRGRVGPSNAPGEFVTTHLRRIPVVSGALMPTLFLR
jgi:hypothetical protein